MGKYVINGGKPLKGEVLVSGAKNSILPILAGTVLNDGITILNNVPFISDTMIAIDILKSLGCSVLIEPNNKLIIDSSFINNTNIPKNLVTKMRSSIIFLGALLARFKNATATYPGGCNLGKRPIDFHIKSFQMLNIKIEEFDDLIIAKTDDIIGNTIKLPFASVGATQNIILSSIFINGETIIKNPAKEPEILDMQNFLNNMGANVSGAGSDEIIIKGVKKLKSFSEYTIMSDRIEAGTFLCAAAIIPDSEIKVCNISPKYLLSLTSILKNMNCNLEIANDSIKISRKKDLLALDFIETAPYPLFPTDLQPQLMALLCTANGKSIIKENIFEARNMHIPELNKMGAKITENFSTFFIEGVNKLLPSDVYAKDLRGGASLIIASLNAKGVSNIYGSEYIKRGYENIQNKLANLGADIKYIED